MSIRYSQDDKVASVAIEGQTDDDLLLYSMFGIDKIGQPFTYTVEMLRNAKVEKVDLSKIIGKILTIKLKVSAKDESVRYFSGYVLDIRYGGLSKSTGKERYFATVVPRISFLKQVWHNRIFRNRTVKEILDLVFKSSTPAFKAKTAVITDISKYPKLEHCVQYGETDYAFVHRLMEEYGISYYFKHSDKKHEMIFLDSSGNRPTERPKDVTDKLTYSTVDFSDNFEIIRHWERKQQVVTDVYERSDFNFANVNKFPDVFSKEVKDKTEQGDFKAESLQKHVYEAAFEEGVFEPNKLKADELSEASEKIAKLQLGAFQAQKDLIYANSDSRKVHVGQEFEFAGYDVDKVQNGEYYVIAVRHQLNVDGYELSGIQSGKRYSCEITAIPKKTEYYPLRTTPKARIYGPQTATVVGAKATDKKLIYTDEYGRVKVHFHWDRVKDRAAIDKVVKSGKDKVDSDTKNLSCWVRVAQGWAGNKWGSFFLPRVGQEVIVEFLDGDPDRPIITGSVYNGKNQPPYKLDKHTTISTIKSESVGKEGEKAEEISFNEIRFEDKEENEQIFIHAAKAMDTRVLGDHREYVGCNMQLTIDGTHKDYKEKADDKNDKLGNRDVKIIGGNDQLTIGEGGNLIQMVGGGQLLNVAGNSSLVVAGNLNIQVTGKILIKAEDEVHLKTTKSIIADATETVSFKAKDITFKATESINFDAGKTIVNKSGSDGIHLTDGSGAVVIKGDVGIDGANVVIKGSKVDINGGSPDPASAIKVAAKDVEEPSPDSTKSLKQAKIAPALKETHTIKSKGAPAKVDTEGIEFSEIKSS